jgi:hypothetical protein
MRHEGIAAMSGPIRVGRGGLRICLAGVAAIAFSLAAGAPGARAAPGLATGLFAPEYLNRDETVRDRWFDATVEANASLVRIDADWGSVVGDQPPANPRDPSDPAYSFFELDRAVRAAQQRGLQVMFTVDLAPAWAEGADRPPTSEARPGTWRPDSAAYGDFAHALATRYSGTFPDPIGSGQALPRVRHYEVWSEANETTFLAPQWDQGGPASPALYRQLLNSLYAGVKAVHADNLVIGPGLAPYGDPPGGSRMRPLVFLRELFCLKGRRHPTSKKQCSKAEIPRLDIFSHHPINLFGAPPDHAGHPDDATSGDLDRIKRILRAAEKARNVKPRGRHPLWVTESFWYSNPPTEAAFAVPLPVQARYLAQAYYLWWSAGAQAVVNFLVRDVSNDGGDTFGPQTFGTGIFFQDGTPKPAFDAFRFPFVADRQRKNKVLAWGKAPSTGELEIQLQQPDGWQTVKQLSVNDGAVFTASLRIPGAATLRAVVGSDASVPWNLEG